MKHIKSFENYSSINEEGIFQEIGGLFSGIYKKVAEKINSWKDAKKKKVALEFAKKIEEKKDDPKVAAKLKEIQEAFAKLSDSDKIQLEKLAKDESKIEEVGKALDEAGVSKMMKEGRLNEEFISKETIGKLLQGLGYTLAVGSIIVMIIGLCTLVGAGFVSLAIGAGLSAGVWTVCCLASMLVGGLIASTGESIQKKK